MLRMDGSALQEASVQQQWQPSWQFDRCEETLGERY
jgi:hypothetical protein